MTTAVRAPIWLITGGARSGKTRLALRLGREAAEATGEPATYIATAQALDDEMSERIEQHRSERPADWRTIEEPAALAAAVREAPPGVILVDCLTLWVSNRLLAMIDGDPLPALATAARDAVLGETGAFIEAAAARDWPVIAVTNEVGSGIVPGTTTARLYRDVLGGVNQRVAAASGRLYLCTAGYALDVKALGAEPVGDDT